MYKVKPVTLQELLDSREARASYQKKLLQAYGGETAASKYGACSGVEDGGEAGTWFTDCGCAEIAAGTKKTDCVLISMTLNIPGPVKDKPAYRKALRHGMDLLAEKLSAVEFPSAAVLHREVRELATGPEGYLVLQPFAGTTPLDIKRLTAEIEDGSALGRLFDIDVLTKEGGISRADLGTGRRKCLLCGEDAKICARSQRHKMEDLLAEVDRILREAGF